MKSEKSQPYFLQTSQWSQFWQESAEKNHQVYFISHKSKDIELSAFVYKYPWHFGKSFLYVPKGPILKIINDLEKPQILCEYKNFLSKITDFAAQNKCIFIKLDFEYIFTNLLDIKDTSNILELHKKATKFEVLLSTKSLQYLSTMIIGCTNLQKNDDLAEFLESNKSFWNQTNENIRRYTRKSLKQSWKINISKTTENFEDFWHVYQYTSKRQAFATHTKSYFETMFTKDFVRIIILKDEQGVPHCCWFGIILNETLYYLYGGNDDYSFSHQGQYLAHLVALQIAAKEEVKSYDLGGYDSQKGFGKFKEGYRGDIVNFLGPIDILLGSNTYRLINFIVDNGKKLKNL